MPVTLGPITLTATHGGYCHICSGRYEIGHTIGRLVGIHGNVCMPCWYYFQLP